MGAPWGPSGVPVGTPWGPSGDCVGAPSAQTPPSAYSRSSPELSLEHDESNRGQRTSERAGEAGQGPHVGWVSSPGRPTHVVPSGPHPPPRALGSALLRSRPRPAGMRMRGLVCGGVVTVAVR